MRAAPILVGAALVLGVILFLSKRAEASTAPAAWTDNVSSWLDNLTQDASANEERYAGTIRARGRTKTELQDAIVDALKNRAIEPDQVELVDQRRVADPEERRVLFTTLAKAREVRARSRRRAFRGCARESDA